MNKAIVNVYRKEEANQMEVIKTTFDAVYEVDENGMHTVMFEDISEDSQTKTKFTFDENHILIDKTGTEKIMLLIKNDNTTYTSTFSTQFGEMPICVKSKYYFLKINKDKEIQIYMKYNLRMASQLFGDMVVQIDIKVFR